MKQTITAEQFDETRKNLAIGIYEQIGGEPQEIADAATMLATFAAMIKTHGIENIDAIELKMQEMRADGVI
jgi:hypothetical protein